MSAQVTEAHRELATELCRNATGSNRALHHVPKFAQLIADSEAKAVQGAVERLQMAFKDVTVDALIAERDQLRAEVATKNDVINCLAMSEKSLVASVDRLTKERDFKASESQAAIAVLQNSRSRAERAEAELERVIAQRGLPLVLGHHATPQWCDAVDAHHAATEAALAVARAKVRTLREALASEALAYVGEHIRPGWVTNERHNAMVRALAATEDKP